MIADIEQPIVRPAGWRALDVGAGAKRETGFETMDISPAFSPDFQHDITRFPWPFDDEAFDEIRCWHVLEHLGSVTTEIDWESRRVSYFNTRIAVMNEMWRILKPGGKADIEVPVFPYWTAIADPTHVAYFVPQSFHYFARGSFQGIDHAEQRELYGVREWELGEMYRNELGAIVRVEMVKP